MRTSKRKDSWVGRSMVFDVGKMSVGTLLTSSAASGDTAFLSFKFLLGKEVESVGTSRSK